MTHASDVLRRARRLVICPRLEADRAATGRYLGALRGTGLEFASVRPYEVGDDPRAIDWNVTARRGHPYVKVYREERQLTVVLLVDVSASIDCGSGARTKREAVAEVAATLAVSALAEQDRLGAVFVSDRVERVLPPARGFGHALRLLRYLLEARRAGRGTRLAAGMECVRRLRRRRCVLFILSDFSDETWPDGLPIVARQHDTVAIVVEDALDRELPDVGLLRVRDPETGQGVLLDTSSARVRDHWAERQRRRVEVRRREFLRARVDSVELVSDGALTAPIARLFARRIARW